MKYQDKGEYQDLVENLIEKCNDDGAIGCVWIVRVKIGFDDGHHPEVTARIAFESHNDYVFTTDKFIQWWEDEYLDDNQPYETWVEIFTNYTPTEICAPKLEAWLSDNQHVTRLTIHFAYVYTWNRRDRRVPKTEYVRRLQNLANYPHSSVRIKKINAYVLSRLARHARVHFPGFQKRWNPNNSLEQAIITHY